MIVFISLLLFVVCGSSAQKLTVQSVGQFASPSFVWANGVPNITFRILLYQWNEIAIEIYYRIILVTRLKNNTEVIYRNATLKNSHVEVAYYPPEGPNRVVTLTIQRPSEDNITGVTFSSKFRRHYVTLQYKNCPTITDPKFISSQPSNSTYNSIATVKCKNSVIMNGSLVVGRFATFTCSHTAQWIRPGNLTCWKGAVIDFNNMSSPYATVEAGIPTILYCDASQSLGVGLYVKNQEKFDQKAAWMFLYASKEDNGLTIFCRRPGVTTFIQLNVPYEPYTTIRFVNVSINEGGWVELVFYANPAINQTNDIQLHKNGALVRNWYLTNNGTNHSVVVHFRNALSYNIGLYELTIKAEKPFNKTVKLKYSVNRSDEVPGCKIYNGACCPSSTRPDLLYVIVTCGVVVVLIFTIVVVALRWKRKLCFSRDTTSAADNNPEPNYMNQVAAASSGLYEIPMAESSCPKSQYINVQPNRIQENDGSYEAFKN